MERIKILVQHNSAQLVTMPARLFPQNGHQVNGLKQRHLYVYRGWSKNTSTYPLSSSYTYIKTYIYIRESITHSTEVGGLVNTDLLSSALYLSLCSFIIFLSSVSQRRLYPTFYFLTTDAGRIVYFLMPRSRRVHQLNRGAAIGTFIARVIYSGTTGYFQFIQQQRETCL